MPVVAAAGGPAPVVAAVLMVVEATVNAPASILRDVPAASDLLTNHSRLVARPFCEERNRLHTVEF